MNLVPVSYFPEPTQQVFADNQRRIRAMPYAEFFTGTMYLPAESIPALQAPISDRHAVPRDQVHRLIDASDAGRAGYWVLPDGTAYIAHHTDFPGALGRLGIKHRG
jgi:hypothetical protein